MNETLNKPVRAELDTWTKKNLNDAVRKFIKQGNIDSLLVEAKPAWALPFQILIGKIRAQGQTKGFEWFICGELPTDYLASSVASTPRETAKHFAMKWQLAAARRKASSGQDLSAATPDPQQVDSGDQLAGQAEALYEVVEDDRLWL